MSFMNCEAQIATWQRVFNNPSEQLRDCAVIAVSMKQTMIPRLSADHLNDGLRTTSEKQRGRIHRGKRRPGNISSEDVTAKHIRRTTDVMF